MKINFHQSGGFDGLTRKCEIDTQTLPRPEAAEIELLVRGSDILKHKVRLFRRLANYLLHDYKLVGCDILYYSVSVESGEDYYSINFHDLNIPNGFRPLLNYLRKHAQPEPL